MLSSCRTLIQVVSVPRLEAAAVLCLASLLFIAGCRSTRPPPRTEGQPGKWARLETSGGARPADPPGRDSDGDSIPDERERALKSDPRDLDTDHDGFDDGLEDSLAQFGFNLIAPSADTDQDGLEDGLERRLGTNPENPDSDGDGWGDFDEVLNQYFGYDPLRATEDADFDGLADELERRIGSSPNAVDTNRDGLDDFPAYSAGVDPAGVNLRGGLGELIATTHSAGMRDALLAIRSGRTFPKEIAAELPYPRVTRALVTEARVKPSAALMQRSAYNPHNSPGIYPPYKDIVSQLYAVASEFDGNPRPDIVRLFHWTQRTVEEREVPGRVIYAMKISDKPGVNEMEPEVLFLGLHHARELLSASNTMRVITDLTQGYASGDPKVKPLVEKMEIWIIAVVNPNGYDRVVEKQIDWRKNTRRIHPTQIRSGVDLNRNYGFEHATTLTPAERAALPPVAQAPNGIRINGDLDAESDQYPGTAEFTEVETQAVRGLAHNQFLTRTGDEVDGLVCSLSWHSYSGLVGHPMGHEPTPPNTGLTGTDATRLGNLSDSVAVGIGFDYRNIRDTFPELSPSNGDPVTGYPVYGASEDWFYKDGHTFALFVEAFSTDEGQGGTGHHYPGTSLAVNAVAEHNFQGALALIRGCPP